MAEGGNVGEFLLEAGEADAVAMIDRDGTHTYADLRAAVDILAGRVAEWGLPPGARVGLLSRNSAFFAAAYLAILRSGLVAVPFATVLSPADVMKKARFVDCDSFLVDSGLSRAFDEVVTSVGRVLSEAAMEGAGRGRQEVVPVEPDADAVLMFTSGTTSAPRAVRVSHRNIRANTTSIIDYLDLTAEDRILVVLPFSYCYGASLLHTHLRVGGSLAICDTIAFPETAIEQIRQERCTGVAGVPSTYQSLLRSSSFETAALPTLRTMQQAGGRLPQPQIERVAAAQPQARLFVMYGATEATARMSYLPPELVRERQGSIGRGIPGVTLSVVDPDGRPVPPGVVGEVFARGDNITKGYWDDPEGTAAKFVDGGLRTGDLARADEEGFLYVVDREADFIKSWGIRISSHEIEDAVVQLPEVAAAAVVGRPDEVAGESVVLFYVTSPGADLTPEQVLTHCRKTLAKPLVPHEVRRVGELPLNQNGKVLKTELRTLASS